MHTKHAEENNSEMGCFNCHPGPATRCLRDVMSGCTDCHGSLRQVGQNSDPWLNEPRCDNAACHGSDVRQNHSLYRFSSGHSGIACSGCHDSPHAIAPSREERDALKFMALQGAPGPLNDCAVCHQTAMNLSQFNHAVWDLIFLTLVANR